MGEIQFGDGCRFNVDDVEIDSEADEVEHAHRSFGDLTIGGTRVDFPAIHMNPSTARLLLGTPVHQPTRSVTVEVPGKRYWWKPWRRRPGHVLHFTAVAVYPEGPDARQP